MPEKFSLRFKGEKEGAKYFSLYAGEQDRNYTLKLKGNIEVKVPKTLAQKEPTQSDLNKISEEIKKVQQVSVKSGVKEKASILDIMKRVYQSAKRKEPELALYDEDRRAWVYVRDRH